MVLAARAETPDARAALEALCRNYRPAVLAYVRGWGYSASDAEDLTQAFFARFLEKRVHASADPARGRFRAFLRTAVHHFVVNEHARATAQQRRPAGVATDIDPDATATTADADLPERAFERAFALLVANRALQALRREAQAAGKGELFQRLKPFLLEPPDQDDYARVAAETGTRPNTLAVATHRLRQRLKELVRAELAETCADPAEIDAEYQAVSAALPASSSARSRARR